MPSKQLPLSLERATFATGVAALLLLAPGAGPLNPVATASAAEEIGEIVVTVRERAENLRNVPGTVSVLTAEQIESSGIQRAKDFIALTPGVSIVNAAEVADSQVNIRGINGARDAETNYALIIDGILMTNPAALNREYLNLRQIEVLKGPQGALYGRNAAAGAFVISTNKPGETFAGSIKASGATNDTFYVAANFGGPIMEGLKFSVDGNWRTSDGYYQNSYYETIGRSDANRSVDYDQDYSIAGRLLWDPTDKLDVDAKVRYNKVVAGSITFNSIFHLKDFAGAGAGFDENVNGHDFLFANNIKPYNNQEGFEASIKGTYDLGWADLTAWTLYSDVRNDLGADGTSGAFGFFNGDAACQASTAALGYGGANIKLSPPQFIGLTPNLALLDPQGSFFGAYTPTTCDGTQYQVRNQKDASLEIRLASKSNQRLRWLGGAYFLHINREVGVNLGLDKGTLDGGVGMLSSLYTTDPQNPTVQLADDQFRTNVVSGFGQLAYDVMDGLEASVALRYDVEHREVRNLVPLVQQTYVQTCATGPNYLNAGQCFGAIAPKSKTFTQVEPKFAVTWAALDNLSVFADIGVGFKSGGFNSQGSQATIDTFINCGLGLAGFPVSATCPVPGGGVFQFAPLGFGNPTNINQGYSPVGIRDDYKKETSWSYEIGQKSDWFGKRLHTEVSYYHTDVKNMQFFEFVVGPFGLLRTVSNIDKVKIDGVEIGANWLASDWLSLNAGANYTYSEIKKNLARPDTVGNKSPYTPDWTVSAGAKLTLPTQWTGVSFVTSLDLSAVGDTWFHVVQDQYRPTAFGRSDDANAQRKPYAILNARVGLETRNWSLVAFGKNFTRTQYLEEVIPAPEFGGSFAHPGSLSRFGLEGTYKF